MQTGVDFRRPERRYSETETCLIHQLKEKSMRYMLLICDNETEFAELPEEDVAQMMKEYGRLSAALQEAGAYVAGHRLRPVSTAKSVRVRAGQTLLTDGPFAETKEQFGGYYLIDVKNLEEALHWAAQIPSARYGTIEVRPVWE
jgi:hypothetical protein